MGNHFDVAIIGMQRAGVIAAALLAKRGRRVLLVDHGENIVTYRRNGLVLPLVPTLVPELESSPHVSGVLDELGIGPELRSGRVALEPFFQAIMPRHRLSFSGGREALEAEVKIEFPEVLDGVRTFFEKLFALDDEISEFLKKNPPLPPNSLQEKWRSASLISGAAHLEYPFEQHKLLAGIPDNHPIRDLLMSPLAFFGHLPTTNPSTFHAVRLLARYFRGTSAYPDRLGGLTGVLVQVAEQAGVEIRRGAIVRQISASGRKLANIEIENDRQGCSASFFVSNTSSPFHDLVEPCKGQTRLAAQQQQVRPVGSLLVYNMVVRREVIPCGMGEALFLLNGRRKPRGDEPPDPPLFLRRYPAKRGPLSTDSKSQDIVDGEHEILSVACPVRTADMRRSAEKLASIKGFVKGRMCRLIPFLESHLTNESLPTDIASWDVEGPGKSEAHMDPWNLHPIYETAEPPLLGVAARPLRTYFKNLLHCGRDVVPGLGIEGEYITGVTAANRLGKMLGKIQ